MSDRWTPERIRERAVSRGIIADNAQLSDREVDQLIFAPGFSTAESVTSLSGRGVGMDVVKRTIEALRGAVEITSTPGQGTTITLRLPLTLAIIDGLLVRVGEATFVVPLAAVEECVELGQAERQGSERAAINAPIQGTSADIIKRAMVRMGPALLDAGLTRVRMLLQVHDELVFEVPQGEEEQAAAVVRRVMAEAAEPAVKLTVPLDVEVGWGAHWGEAH